MRRLLPAILLACSHAVPVPTIDAGPAPAPKHLGTMPAPKLGASLGTDAGAIGSDGLVQYQLATPIAPAFSDDITISAIEVTRVICDPAAGICTAIVRIVGDLTGERLQPLTWTAPAIIAGEVNAIKIGIAARDGWVFQ